jgi:xanthine dehydrogenase YagS FAD-binding subunit
MNSFKWAEPQTIEQAAALLAAGSGQTLLMSGGTDLLGQLKEGLVEPDIVIDLAAIPGLSYIKKEKEGVSIGPLTTIAELAADPMIEQDYPGLHQAASVIASPQLRNVGTVGGNLCQRPRCWYFRNSEIVCRKKGGSRCYAYRGRNKYHAIFGGGMCYIVYPSDLAPMLIALGAAVTIASPRGDRTIPLADFYALPSKNVRRENSLAPDELVREIRIPPVRKEERSAYLKLEERATWDFALVSCAARALISGRIPADLRIVMGGVAPVPWRLEKAEAALKGKNLTEDAIRSAARTALEDSKPLEENAYKKQLVEVAVTRTLLSLAG